MTEYVAYDKQLNQMSEFHEIRGRGLHKQTMKSVQVSHKL